MQAPRDKCQEFQSRPGTCQDLFCVRDVDTNSGFELTLYVMRRKIEAALRKIPGADCYVASLSSVVFLTKAHGYSPSKNVLTKSTRTFNDKSGIRFGGFAEGVSARKSPPGRTIGADRDKCNGAIA